MAAGADRRFELDELIVRPGTYFNPQTEVVLVVDDSASMDSEIFNLEEFEGADWVLVSDELPIDEAQRDEMLESFQARHAGGDGRDVQLDADELDDDVEEVEEAPQAAEEIE
ncbi:MAG: hypothetical protein QOK25_2667 [Thermoleophilaceae bacterium]|jgi:hypothetical protein|nr:hypothetical protein [Thermoleophilaceae bacterium]